MSEMKPSTIDFDPDGDVILVLSDETHLRVSSKVLSLTSDVFAKMLTSQFKEGLSTNPTPGTAHSISLPDEDVEAFILLCNVIHYRMHLVPRQPTLTCLENLAIICDKWNFIGAIATSSEAWLHIWMESVSGYDLNRLLFMAYILDTPYAFSKISWKILVAQVGPFVDIPGLADHKLVPVSLLGDFKMRKPTIDMAFIAAMETPLLRLTNCGQFTAAAGDYINKLYGANLWPMVDQYQVRSISLIYQQVLNMSDLKKTGWCNRPSCACRSINLKDLLREKMKNVLNINQGLCLDCVKTGGQSRREKSCRLCVPEL